MRFPWLKTRTTKINARRRPYAPRLEKLEDRLTPATFLVTNTGSSGLGTLDQAVQDANANPGLDSIVFNIPGLGRLIMETLTEASKASFPAN